MRTPIQIAAALALAAGLAAAPESAAAHGWARLDRSSPQSKALGPDHRAAPYPYWYYGRPQPPRSKRNAPPPFYIEPSPQGFAAPMSRHQGLRSHPTFGFRR